MTPEIITLLALCILIVLVFIGIPIGIALASVSLLGTIYLFGDIEMGSFMAGNAAFSVLRSYVFATIPLFIVMGVFITVSGVARDVFIVTNRLLKLVPGRLAVATVIGNAVFAAISGVSIASAAAFSNIAYPEMRRYNYKRTLSLGVIASSAMLGMLIPPSILLIFWGILTEISIGKLFVAGILPGMVVSALFIAYIVITAFFSPRSAPYHASKNPPPFLQLKENSKSEVSFRSAVYSSLSILLLILLTIGGIWGGLFTPTESAGVGVIGALVLAVCKGVDIKTLYQSTINTGKVIAPIMFLLLTAAMYSQFLVSSNAISIISNVISGTHLGLYGTIAVITIIWLVMGMILDSTSIILLTVPIFAPIMGALGMDPFVFAIYGILIIEAGLLTPPLGILVYVVKGAVPENVTLSEVFLGAFPFCCLIIFAAIMVLLVPQIATLLPSLM